MLDLEDQLRRYGEALERDLMSQAEQAPGGPGPRRRPGKALALAAVIVVAVAVGVTAVIARQSADRDQVVSTDQSDQLPPGAFSTPTNTVLLFSDGIDGVTAIDLDHRRAGRRVIDGERAGDQQFRLTLTDGRLVVGWGEIYAAPLDGSASKKVADATIYLPAAEPGEVWTITWAGGRIGTGDAVLERVGLDGVTVFRSTSFDPEALRPVTGVPGGLLVSTTVGVAVWNADTGTTGPVLGPGPAEAATSDGHIVAWCVSTCSTVHTAALERTGRPTAPSVQPGSQSIALSPNGRDLAVLRASGDTSELVIMTAAAKDQRVVARGLDAYPALTWSNDGSQLFVTTNSYKESATRIGRYEVASGRWEMTTVTVGDLLAAIALDPDQANSFFSNRLVPARDCPGANGSFPSGRTGTCTFAFR